MFKLRKSFKIAKGVRVNVGKKGVSSLSLGGKGLTVNTGKKGVRATASIPGSGLSYSKNISSGKSSSQNSNTSNDASSNSERKVSILLGLGIFLMPYIFVWFLLRKGYSKLSRYIGFIWLSLIVISISNS